MANVEGRSCGTCTLCCKLFDIRELDKPQFEWCKHCAIGQGCKIYDQRPQECRTFNCSYLIEPALGEEWRPSKSKIVLTMESGNLVGVHVDPDRPDAWRREPFYSQIQRWAKTAATTKGQVVVWEGQNAVALLPSGEETLGPVPAGHHIVFRMGKGPDGRPKPDAVVMSPDDPGWSQDEFDGALRTDQDTADAYFNRGLAFAAKGEFEHAIDDYNTAIEREPKLAAAWDARALARLQINQMDEAIVDSDEAAALAPKNAGILNNRAMILSVAGRSNEALAMFDAALNLDPGYVRAYFNRGNARARSGDAKGALVDFTRAIELDESYLPAHTERALTNFCIGNFVEADVDFEFAARRDSDQQILWRLWRHVSRSRGGLPQIPLPTGTDGGPWPAPLVAMFNGKVGPGLALTAAPDGDPDGLFFVGQFHLLHENEPAAIEHFRRAVEGGNPTSYGYDGARAELRRLDQLSE